MKTKVVIFASAASFIAILVAGSGCATPPKGAEKAEARLLELARDGGAPVAQMLKLFPDAKEVSAGAYATTRTVDYVTDSDVAATNFWVGFGHPKAHQVQQTLTLYFTDGKFTRWSEDDIPLKPRFEPTKK